MSQDDAERDGSYLCMSECMQFQRLLEEHFTHHIISYLISGQVHLSGMKTDRLTALRFDALRMYVDQAGS